MSVKSLTVGELGVNCYFIIDDDTGKTFIVDPGAEPERILSEAKRCNLKIDAIINTHGHADHIAGNSHIKSQCKGDLSIYIHQQDAPMLTDPEINLSAGLYFPGRQNVVSPPADVFLKDGDIITLNDKIKLEVIHTPGHTDGSICLVCRLGLPGRVGLHGGEEYVLTGDTLFCGSVGRWDLPGGDEAALMNSLKKLRILPKSMPVLPGHGPESTIADELKNNPFF